MPLTTKLKILAEAAKYDVSCGSSGSRRPGSKQGLGHSDGHSICHSFTPDGRCVSLLKILLTNHCMYDCVFCVNRVSSDIPRAAFTPHEVVELTLDFYRRNYIEGLFLSSGIFRSPDDTMEQLVAVVRTLREEHRFGGYIHLKAIPGASARLIEDAGRWVDRLSANIELPTQAELVQLAPDKHLTVIERTMGQIQEGVQAAAEDRSHGAPSFVPAGQTTQMVIGATPSTDAVILSTAARLYQRYRLRRVYYSAFSPYPHADPRLPLHAPPLMREHRLYQADWLTRFYGFSLDELTTADDPNLSFDLDPKLAWALRHRDRFPVDVNRAPREMLLRVPGLGYKNVDKILSIRRYHRIALDDLRRLRVPLRRVRPFVVTPAHTERHFRLDREDLPSLLSKPRSVGTVLCNSRGGLRTNLTMYEVRFSPTPDAWLYAASEQLAARRPAAEIVWTEATAEQSCLPGLFAGSELLDIPAPQRDRPSPARTIPAAFRSLVESVACHRDESKWRLLYSVLWRLTSTEPHLLAVEVDEELSRLLTMQREVQRDAYRMKAFVRFRRVTDGPGDHYVAWHQPDHPVLPLAAPFFVERFASLRWSILTPDASSHWDGHTLRFGPGITQRDAPADDALDQVWREYYSATFNPARLNRQAMQAQLPGRYWKGLPESRLITTLAGGVRARVGEFIESRQRMAAVPVASAVPELAQAAASCTGCDLHLAATQTVFGHGPMRARIMLVGEQPGDQEDIDGQPFVGPAGAVLNQALQQAGLDRSELYVTNAVKHFRFVTDGRRRRHQAPRPSHVMACRPWLEAELKAVAPQVVVCLGRTAAQSLIGGHVSMEQQRGQFFGSAFASRILLTYHPSSILRTRDDRTRDLLFTRLVDDLKRAGSEVTPMDV